MSKKTQQLATNLQKVRLKLEDHAQSIQHYQKYLKKIEAKLKHLSTQERKVIEISKNNKLVHCVLLTFYFNKILERCLDGLFSEKDRIDVTVIENSSVNSDAIRKVVDLYKKKGLVKNHFIFDDNIGTNAFEVAFDSNLLDLNYDYITVTDGDLVPDQGWLDEQITILEKFPEVFSVSSDLYYHNAPHPVRTGITKIAIESENEIYKERLAGWWLKTFRRKDWQDFVNYRKANNIYFHDKSAYDYGKLNKNMKSVLAKSFKSYHLTWDYVDENYLKMKGSLKGKTHDPWYHNKYSSFKLINVDNQERFFSAPKEVIHQRININQNVAHNSKIISKKPYFYKFYYTLGLASIQQKCYDKAVLYLKKTIELNSRFPESYTSLGNVLSKLKKWDEAIIYYQKAFDLKPQLLGQYSANLALALRKKNLFSQMISLYLRVIETYPEKAIELPIIFTKNIGIFVTTNRKPKSTNYKITYTDIPLQNQTKVKPTITIHQALHPQFTTPHPNTNNFVVLIPHGRVWSNDSWGVVVTNSENETFIKRMFRKPDITDLMSIKNLPPVLDIEGVAVFLSSRWGDNYYHWIFDVISRLELLIHGGIEINCLDKLIINSCEKKFQKETLNALGIPQAKVIESYQNHHIKANRLIVPSLPLAAPSKWNCDFIRRQLMPLKNQVKLTQYKERIYISRQDSMVRRLVNEDRVIEFLSKLGFYTVSLSFTSLAEQVSLFANAKVIVAVHGAALTNIVFCQSGTKVVELFGPDAVRNCYHMVANHCNLEHYYIIGESSSSRHDLPRNRDLDVVINIDLLSKLLQVAGVN